MKAVKASISRVKSLVSELPDGDDLFGFVGINKELLTSALNETYSLVDRLEPEKQGFDIIYLKRKVAQYASNCHSIKRRKVSLALLKEPDFDMFISNVFNIRVIVKETYLLVIEGHLRKDVELLALETDIDDYKTHLDGLIKTYEKTDIKSKEIEDKVGEISDWYETITKKEVEISELVDTANLNCADISLYKKRVIENMDSVIDARQSIVKNKLVFNKSIDRFDNLSSDVEALMNKVESINNTSKELGDKMTNQQSEIERILEDTNRASMAGSFKGRKEELDKPIRYSNWVMIVSLVIVGLISAWLALSSGLGKGDFNITEFLVKLPIVAPFIFLAWTSNIRNNHLIRIKEDYAFKYAAAMAYEGYRKQVQGVDKNLEMRLLELSIEHMGLNPIRLFDKNIKTSPINDVAKELKDTVGTIVDIKNTGTN